MCWHLALLIQPISSVVAFFFFFFLFWICCSTSSATNWVSALLLLLLTSKIWRFGIWPRTQATLRGVLHAFMFQSNTRWDAVFWNYIVCMFSVLFRKICEATGFSFCSVCLHGCDSKKCSNTMLGLVVGEKKHLILAHFSILEMKSQLNKLCHRQRASTLSVITAFSSSQTQGRWELAQQRLPQLLLSDCAASPSSSGEGWMPLLSEVHGREDVVTT